MMKIILSLELKIIVNGTLCYGVKNIRLYIKFVLRDFKRSKSTRKKDQNTNSLTNCLNPADDLGIYFAKNINDDTT